MTKKTILPLFILFVFVGCNRASIEGKAANLSETRDDVNFSSVQAGDIDVQRFRLVNSGETPALSIELSSPKQPFRLLTANEVEGQDDLCGTQLDPQAECFFVLEFVPTTSGKFSDAIQLSYFNGNSETSESIELHGEATPLPQALLVASGDTDLSYGSLELGQTKTLEFSVKNTGTGAATDIVFPGLSSPFRYVGGVFPGISGTCSTNLEPDQSCSVSIEFVPNKDIAFQALSAINYNDGTNTQRLDFEISGTGLKPTEAFIAYTEGFAVNFDAVKIAESSEKTLVFQNFGDRQSTGLQWSGIDLPFSFKGGAFPGNGGDCGGDLVPNGTCEIVILFSPDVADSYSKNLTITYDNGVQVTTNNIQLVGEALPLDPALLAKQPTGVLDFGSSDVNVPNLKTIFIENTGEVVASTVFGSQLSVPFDWSGGWFPGSAGTCTTEIQPGETCQLELEFKPAIGGEYTGLLNLNYNDGDGPQLLSIALKGVGNADGQLDDSFNSSGLVTLDFGAFEGVVGLAMHPAGQIIAAGEEEDSGSGLDENFATLMFNPDGSLDTDFGNGGRQSTDIAGGLDDVVKEVLVIDGGEILMIGNVGSKIGVSQLDDSGILDLSFAGNGKFSLDLNLLGLNTDTVTCATLQPDGSILVAGEHQPILGKSKSFVIRLADSGVLDLGFGFLGSQILDLFPGADEHIHDMQLDQDLNIIVSGAYDNGGSLDSFTAKLSTTGLLMGSFGIGGIQKEDLSGSGLDDSYFEVAIQSDNKILMAGTKDNGANKDLIVRRLNSDGSSDTAFGNNGSYVLDLDNDDDIPGALALDGDEKILVAGYSKVNGTEDALLVRLEETGQPDIAFGKNGVVTYGDGASEERIQSMVLQVDGKIVLGGSSTLLGERDYFLMRFTP